MYLFQVMNMTMRTAWSSEAGTADPWPSGCSEVRCCRCAQCTAPRVAIPAHSPPGDTSRSSVTRAVLCNARETLRYELACVLCNITCRHVSHVSVCRHEGGGQPAPRPQARGLHHPLPRHQPQHTG